MRHDIMHSDSYLWCGRSYARASLFMPCSVDGGITVVCCSFSMTLKWVECGRVVKHVLLTSLSHQHRVEHVHYGPYVQTWPMLLAGFVLVPIRKH
jgi:hypothetical protein